MYPKFNWSDAAKIILALIASGFVWTVDNQMALLALAAMVIVWLVKIYAVKTGREIGKFELTLVLLVISIGFAFLFQPVSVDAIPSYGGDVIGYINAWFGWLGSFLLIGKSTFAIATGLYNILLADVLKKLEPEPKPLRGGIRAARRK